MAHTTSRVAGSDPFLAITAYIALLAKNDCLTASTIRSIVESWASRTTILIQNESDASGALVDCTKRILWPIKSLSTAELEGDYTQTRNGKSTLCRRSMLCPMNNCFDQLTMCSRNPR